MWLRVVHFVYKSTEDATVRPFEKGQTVRLLRIILAFVTYDSG